VPYGTTIAPAGVSGGAGASPAYALVGYDHAVSAAARPRACCRVYVDHSEPEFAQIRRLCTGCGVVTDHDLGANYHTRRMNTERRTRSHVRQLEALGYNVTLAAA
jgi:hypothetical protein